MSTRSYHEIVFDQLSKMMTDLNSHLLVTKRVRRNEINRDSDVICMCAKLIHTGIQKTIQECCKYTFHSECVKAYLTCYHACPYCNDMTMATSLPITPPTEGQVQTGVPSATSIQQQLCNDTASDIGPFCQEVVPTNNPINSPIYDAHPKTKADEVREESVKKRRMLQDCQGDKMKKRHEESLKQLGKEVKRGSMITLHVNPRVASHACGVTAVVVDCLPDTGGVIAYSSKGIIINGKGKKEWWIAADMYRLNSGPGELFTAITPELAAIQKLIIEGQFDASHHPKCTLGDPHRLAPAIIHTPEYVCRYSDCTYF